MDEIFEARVQAQVGRLQGARLRALEREVALRRIAWMRERRGRLPSPLPTSPEKAYELLLFEYLGLDPHEAPIVCQAVSGIEWISRNPCPTLEACEQLGLDTRHVCRQAYERSTQAFISQVSPQLRFYRRYSQIRPLASGCREGIFLLDFGTMLAAARQAAAGAGEESEQRRGAVLVLGRHIVGRSSQDLPCSDPTLHAEMVAIRQAARTVGGRDLCGGVLFVTSPPCEPCVSHAARSGLTTLVYEAGDGPGPSPGKGDSPLPAAGTSPFLDGWFEVIQARPSRAASPPAAGDSSGWQLSASSPPHLPR